MNIRTLSAIAFVTAAIASPVVAQAYDRASAQKPVHALRHYRGTYNEVRGPDFVAPRAGAYGDSNFDRSLDHSRIGDHDPDFNPAGS